VKRIQIILGVLAIVVTAFAAISGPALADDLNCRDARGDLIRCDGEFYSPYDDDDYFYDDDYGLDDYYFSPYSFNPYYYYGGFDDYSHGCEGPVCLID
jgi:hypothetical protein